MSFLLFPDSGGDCILNLELCASPGVFHNDLARLFADHVNRRDDEEAWDLWKDRGIDDAKILRPDDAEAAVDDGHRIVRLSHLATARCVMAPGVVLDPFRDL